MSRQPNSNPSPHGRGRTGRRPGPTRTRAQILDAARSSFATHGYDAVSIRAVARDAGVDQALVHRFFGSKEQLFIAAMQLPVAPGELVAGLLAGGTEDLGERIVRTLLAIWDSPGAVAPFLALIRAAVSNEQAATMLREFLTAEVLERIAAATAPDQRKRRAALAASQVIGLAMARHVLAIPELADADHTELAASIGATIQNYLTGPLPPPGG